MKEKRYYWLKLSENFFREPEVKKLRQLPGGDIHTIIYQKLMLLSLETGGTLYFSGIDDTLEAELALTIDEDANTVRMCIMYLEKVRLIEYIEDRTAIIMRQVPELIGSETDAARRQRKSRNLKQKCDIVTPLSHPSHTSVTQIIDKDIDKDIDDDIINTIISNFTKKTKIQTKKTKKLKSQIEKKVNAIGKNEMHSYLDYIIRLIQNNALGEFIPTLDYITGNGFNEYYRKFKNKKLNFRHMEMQQDYDIAAIEHDFIIN